MKHVFLASVSAACLALSACGGGSSGSSASTNPGGGTTNTAPVANDVTASTLQDDAVEITLSATDADGDALTYTLATQPSSGTATLSGATVSYTPNADYAGADSFTFTASDGTASSNSAAVNLTIDPASFYEGTAAEADGTPVPSVMVEALDDDGNLVTSVGGDADGNFQLKAKTDQALVLKFSATDYANQVTPVTMASVKSFTLPLDVMMIKRGSQQSIDIDQGGTLTGNEGASVTVEPGSFVDTNGNSVTGDIQAHITPVDVSDPIKLAAFPGDFVGIEEANGTRTAIVSLGTSEFVFTQGGVPLQLADGKTAEIILPIYTAINPETGLAFAMDDTIDLWSLNEDTGIWTQEGEGVVVANPDSPTGLALKATVSHFTWWNVDYPVDTAGADITISGNVTGGVAIIHARVEGYPGFRPASANTTVGQTVSGLVVPVNQTTCFWAEYLDTQGATAFTDEQCVADAIAGTVYPLTFDVLTSGALTLADNSYYRPQNYSGRNIRIYTYPLSLETTVTYQVTSGSLPPGLTLTNDSPTTALISGSTTQLGTYNITLTGEDAEGFTDTRDVTFSVSNPPPPALRSQNNLYGEIGNTFSRTINLSYNGASAPTSWIVTKDDNSAVPSGVSISNAGVLTIANYDGATATYKVTAYNAQGASNSVTVMVLDKATSPPILSSSVQLYAMEYDSSASGDLQYTNTGAPASSWSVTKNDGTAAPSDVTIDTAGRIVIPSTYFYDTFKVTAYNGALASNVMSVTIYVEIDPGPMPCDGNDPFCMP